MLILAIDTSAVASAALLSDDRAAGLDSSFATSDTRSHAEVLVPGIHDLMTAHNVGAEAINAIVVGVGPGPFTGLRSGIATARTLAYVWNKPLYGVMSLDAVALQVAESEAAVPEFAVATDARRKEVYWATYRLDADLRPHLAEGPYVGPAKDLPALQVFGAGAGLYADDLLAHPDFCRVQPDALHLGRSALARLLASEPLLDSTPLYLRESDAQVPGPRKRAL
ncbi:tRNA (adenosine(37)-N6)-threonylcarbamoyltransferase complex dimerization subunit type 1 TsaB [Pseudarthrobacter sp. PS3-L1]|uniref:tRNA (adenosine(37)-N6)-threonylcarbamoyltransferase complex dimerization subunit type 1 TsaB n=1 Tax=Pseudarthrobacter sp. PS3-L1 TaxID=3046207 RepID=UPI0024BBE01D|nr:tRNA (adenosine(37)-N6)-threonylcarbamoyltransferase complex dimerization subunit type 1 TsaB [Pseudarthrobacter sp. PS3-L1]MDJ0321329.1 tRNA (adenosine(37)-N6)-threonylcarbamoyltransferase complex dimerization subunit type 1 TsaB [Pseudarthrobacter sp. PS3-L1]